MLNIATRHKRLAATKLGAFIVLAVLIGIQATDLRWTLSALLLVATGFAVARIPLNVAWEQLRGAVVIVTFVCAVTAIGAPLIVAVARWCGFMATIAAAVLLAITTPATHILAVIDTALRPLGRLGVPVGMITLGCLLVLRSIPAALALSRDVASAAQARGAATRGPIGRGLAIGVPFVVGTLVRAQALTEALYARGVIDLPDDPNSPSRS